MVRPGKLVPSGWLSSPSPPLLRAQLGSLPQAATPHLSKVGFSSRSIGKVAVPGGTALWYCTTSSVLCWYGRTFRNIVTRFPSAFLALLVSVKPSALRLPDVWIGWHPTACGSTPTPRPLLPCDVLRLGAHVSTFFPGPVSRDSQPDLPPSATGLPSLGGIL